MKNKLFYRKPLILILIVTCIYIRYFVLLGCELKTRGRKLPRSYGQGFGTNDVKDTCDCIKTDSFYRSTVRQRFKSASSNKFNSVPKNSKIGKHVLNGVSMGISKRQNNGTLPNKAKFLEIFQKVPGADVKELVKEMKDKVGNESTYSVESICCSYLINPRHRCNKPDGFDRNFLIFIVKSSYEHWSQRQTIRQTWGNETYLKDYKLRTVFVLGQPNNGINYHVTEELSLYDDILQLNIRDVYYNNTFKTIATFHWLSQYCRFTTKYVMMVDDDYYVSPEVLVNILNTITEKRTSQLYMGAVYEKAKPHKVKDKFYLSKEDYPYRYFPPYIPAGSIIMSIDFVLDVQLAMRVVKPFKFDDVYIGIIAYFLHVLPRNLKEIFISKKRMLKHRFSSVVASHGFMNDQLLEAWRSHTNSLKIKNG